jgi:hypothetical protein
MGCEVTGGIHVVGKITMAIYGDNKFNNDNSPNKSTRSYSSEYSGFQWCSLCHVTGDGISMARK